MLQNMKTPKTKQELYFLCELMLLELDRIDQILDDVIQKCEKQKNEIQTTHH